MKCEKKRDADNLEGPVKAITQKLPWAKGSIDKINRFKPQEKIVQGFDYIRQVELLMDEEEDDEVEERIAELQIEQLMAIADHEQRNILQPLVYDRPDFKYWTRIQRDNALARWSSPKFQLSFSHRCKVSETQFRSDAPKKMEIEDFKSRMKWIGNTAKKFHMLMDKEGKYMLQELTTIASWVDTPDD